MKEEFSNEELFDGNDEIISSHFNYLDKPEFKENKERFIISKGEWLGRELEQFKVSEDNIGRYEEGLAKLLLVGSEDFHIKEQYPDLYNRQFYSYKSLRHYYSPTELLALKERFSMTNNKEHFLDQEITERLAWEENRIQELVDKPETRALVARHHQVAREVLVEFGVEPPSEQFKVTFLGPLNLDYYDFVVSKEVSAGGPSHTAGVYNFRLHNVMIGVNDLTTTNTLERNNLLSHELMHALSLHKVIKDDPKIDPLYWESCLIGKMGVASQNYMRGDKHISLKALNESITEILSRMVELRLGKKPPALARGPYGKVNEVTVEIINAINDLPLDPTSEECLANLLDNKDTFRPLVEANFTQHGLLHLNRLMTEKIGPGVLATVDKLGFLGSKTIDYIRQTKKAKKS
ncbi:MAG: hypothetical protein WC621_02385 [Patescibacteria group bacterium]